MNAPAGLVPQISDYGVIGDCRTAALVSRWGSIDWYCLPDFHSASIFAGLLDVARGGHFRVSGVNAGYWSRSYIQGTNVLQTRFHTGHGMAEVTDFMPISDNYLSNGSEPERELIRVIEAKGGEPEVEVDCALRPDYARVTRPFKLQGNSWELEYNADLHLLRSDIELRQIGPGRLIARAKLKAGEKRCISLSFTRRDAASAVSLGEEVRQKLAETIAWWRGWFTNFTYDGPFSNAVARSLLTLKLLASSRTGALIAAPTTSLPEAIGSVRNWDYRYCWLRDASFTLRALIDAGFIEEGAAFFNWLLHSTRRTAPELQTVYDIYGRTNLTEYKLDHLEGFRGSRPVRVGNQASNQLQLDIYGSVILAAHDYVERGGSLQPAEARLLASFGDVVTRRWKEPDNGIWEYRDRRMHNTYSKLMCWTALDRLERLAAERRLRGQVSRWTEARKAIRAAIDRYAWDARQNTYVGAFGEPFVDAAMLLMARSGYIEATDPRMRGTVRAISRRLAHHGLIRRYDRISDGFNSREGEFLACNFWLAEYLARAGRDTESHEMLERLVGLANDLGLLSEEVDAIRGVQLGNFPQAFSHLGLVNAGLALSSVRQGQGIR